MHIAWSRHRGDFRVHHCIIDCLSRQKYHILKVKHRYQINRYCKLLNKQKLINGCWKLDFDKILLTHCKYKSLIWINRWICCATRWQPTQFRQVGSLSWNRTRVSSSGLLMTRTANLATVRFVPGPGPEVTVRNRCQHYLRCLFNRLGFPSLSVWPPCHVARPGPSVYPSGTSICTEYSTVHWDSWLASVKWPSRVEQLNISTAFKPTLTSPGS